MRRRRLQRVGTSDQDEEPAGSVRSRWARHAGKSLVPLVGHGVVRNHANAAGIRAQSRCRRGRGEPSPGAHVAGMGAVLEPMWHGWQDQNQTDGNLTMCKAINELAFSWALQVHRSALLCNPLSTLIP